eukprot:scaffold129908_cov18-Tisochrysis_lutea.AAC.3
MYTHTHIYTSLGGVTCSCRLHGFAPGGPVSGDHRHMQRTLSLTYDDLGNLARTIAGSRNANSVDVIGDAVTNIMNPQGKEQEHLHTGGSEKSSQGAAAARDEVSNRASCCRYTADVEQKRCKMEGRKMGMVGAGVNYGAKEQVDINLVVTSEFCLPHGVITRFIAICALFSAERFYHYAEIPAESLV